MKNIIFIILLAFSTGQTAIAQASPWGTGTINNVFLDTLLGPSVYTSHTLDVFDLDAYLIGYTFNIYIPADYDGTKPYGLITFINSGNNGAYFNSWDPVLDEKNMIVISGNNIGNSIPVITRMGVALAGFERLKEILNIDTSRVYTSGNSGGARSCTDLMFFFPEYFKGVLSNCGSSYLRQVDQDYETAQLNSHYEYGIFQYAQVHLDYVNSFDRKYAIMTAFNDFREGDIMNIYHNGMEPDGFKSKFLEINGSHCTTSAQHFRDAINFVEHPHNEVIIDSFALQPKIGNGFKLESATIANQQLTFTPTNSNNASAYSNNPILWNDAKGAIIRTSLELDSGTYNQNSFFNIGLLDFSDPTIYLDTVGHELNDSLPNLLMSIVFDSTQPTVFVLAENPHGSISNDTLFSGTFTDWSANQPLNIKYHLWNQEIRIEFGNHFNQNAQLNSFTQLLHDNRSVRIRTNSNYWSDNDFNTGTLLTFVTGKLDTSLASTPISLNFVEVIAAETLPCNSITTLTTMTVDSVETCTPLQWIDGITYTASNATATHTLANANGCDSVVTLNLVFSTLDDSVTQSGPLLTAFDTGAIYQWYNCNGMVPISGATNQSYTATTSGDYAVVVNKLDCYLTSNCYYVSLLGVIENNFDQNLIIYPNPTNGNFSIDLGKNLHEVTVTIRDFTGKVVPAKTYHDGQVLYFDLKVKAGIYLICIESGNQKAIVRIVKQ